MTLRFGTADRPDVRAGTVAELLALSPGERAGEPLAWLRDGTGFVGWGQAWRLDPGAGPERFARAGAALAEAFAGWDGRGAAPVAMAAFTFDPAAHGSFVRVPELLVHSGAAARAVAAGAGPDARPDALAPLAATVLPERATADRVRYAGASLPDLLWLDAVAAATRLIDKGDIDKVVLARDHAVWSEAPFEPRVLAARLAARFPGCFTFVAEGLVGASPEMLVRRRGTRVESLVLAGSAARGDGAADDAARGDALLASAKDRAEHAFAVASVREALAPLCRTLESDAEPSLLRLDNVQHLATRFGGTLAEPAPARCTPRPPCAARPPRRRWRSSASWRAWSAGATPARSAGWTRAATASSRSRCAALSCPGRGRGCSRARASSPPRCPRRSWRRRASSCARCNRPSRTSPRAPGSRRRAGAGAARRWPRGRCAPRPAARPAAPRRGRAAPRAR